MAKSQQELAQTMIDNLPEKTGKSLTEWQALIAKSGAKKHGEMMKLLKGEHGVTHGFANLIAQKCTGNMDTSHEDLIANQYRGKESLKPIHDAIISFVQTFGADLEIAPKKTCVSLRRKKQFALIQPSTKTRIDIGINLKGDPGSDRLLAEKPGSMCTHKIRVSDLSGVDAELKAWLKDAYDRAG